MRTGNTRKNATSARAVTAVKAPVSSVTVVTQIVLEHSMNIHIALLTSYDLINPPVDSGNSCLARVLCERSGGQGDE